MLEVTAAPKPHDMEARVERVRQQLRDGAIAGAATTLRQKEGVAVDPALAPDIQAMFPTAEPRPAKRATTITPWTEAFRLNIRETCRRPYEDCAVPGRLDWMDGAQRTFECSPRIPLY
eukprot:8047094-Prorocentrum_lima.AAC.1